MVPLIGNYLSTLNQLSSECVTLLIWMVLYVFSLAEL